MQQQGAGSGSGLGSAFGSAAASGSGFGSSSTFGSSFGSASGSNPGFGPGSGQSTPGAGGSSFGSFARPQPPSASTSSAPPNTFSRPPSGPSNAPSAFTSGFSQGGQQQTGFGRPRPFTSRPRPQFQQQSSFGNSRPFNSGQHHHQQGQEQQQQQQQSPFGNRPRPFTARPSGLGGPGHDGRPPMSGSFRGGRGGGAARPGRPFVSNVDGDTSQRGPTDANPNLAGASGNHAYQPRPRPRPFANKSTTFNTQPAATPSAFGSQSSGQAPATPSAFGAAGSSQSASAPAPKPASTFGFGQTSASTPSIPPSNGFGQSSSAFGSSSTNPTSGSPSLFGAPQGAAPASASAFGASSSTSAFGSTSSSAFGSSSNSTAFGSTPAATQAKLAPATTAAPAPSPAASAPPSTFAPAPANAAPTSSFSNFLRKDRTGTSTPAEGSGSPMPSANFGSKGAEDEDELRKKRFEEAPKVGNRFLEMKGGREALRNAYIKSGVLPDPDKPTDLALAVKLVGTCQDMCPEFEREEREFQKELDPLEVYPGTDRVDPRIAVKIYRRPAAGRELPLPEDVRPPPVLKRTLDYLFHDLLPADPNDPRFTAVQGFLWNRTRAVRQDFIVQSEGGAIAIECHERIARYHILCLHWRGGPGAEGWSEQQELEQLRKTMRSLIEFYDDNRRKSATSAGAVVQPSPNEAEFRAYNLLLHLRDPETLREAELLPGDIFRAPAVQTALNLRQLAQRSNNLEKRGQPRNTEATLNFFSKFFAELRKPSVNYLMACLAENSFSSVRVGAVKAMGKAYMAQHRGLPIETMRNALAMDSDEQVIALCTHLGLEFEYDGPTPAAVKIHKTAAVKEDKPLISPFSLTIVEAKRGSWKSADVIDGRASGAGAILPDTPNAAQGFAPVPSMAKPAPGPTSSSLDFNAPSQADGSLDSISMLRFGQSTAGQDARGTSAFSASSPSKLSAAATSFMPSAFGSGSARSAPSTAAPAGSFGGLGGFGGSSATKQESPAKSGLPSFGGFGKEPATDSKPTATTLAPDTKSPIPSLGSAAKQTTPSSLPSFSFGQPNTKAPSAAATTDAKPTSPFTFGPSQTKDAEPSKTTMPSFFSSSSKPQDSKTEKPGDAASGPSKLADADAGSSAPVATSQKRRGSDPAAAAASRAAAAAVAEAEAKVRVKRKEAARAQAVEQAFKTLSSEAIQSAAAKTAAAAVQEERARRRAASRDELLTRLSDKMWAQLAEERVAAAAEDAARKAAAEVLRSRSGTMRAWQHWRDALEERRDREHQKQRLETIRSEIKRRNVLGRIQVDASGTSNGSAQGTHSERASISQSLLTGVRRTSSGRDVQVTSPQRRKLAGERSAHGDDAELSAQWTRVRRQRGELWAEGSLLDRLADHVEEVLLHFRPADLDGLVVLYSGAPGQHVASNWLRVKFGFSPSVPASRYDGRDALEVGLADGSHLALVDVTRSGDGATLESMVLAEHEEHSEVGLVVFETNPIACRASSASQRRAMVTEDRSRLEEIAQSRVVKQSRLACRLLLVTWGDTDTQSTRSATSDGAIEDVEMADGTAFESVAKDATASLITSLGLDPSKTVRSTGAVDGSDSHEGSALLSRAFERVGVLELADASVSIESTLTTLLTRAMPDLAPNLDLDGARRVTLDEVARELVDQWSRTCVLLCDLVCAIPPSVLSGTAVDLSAKAEDAACKALCILSALANYVVRAIVSRSELTPDAEVVEVAVPTRKGLVEMALEQLEALPEGVAEQREGLRYRLLSTLPERGLEATVAHVNRMHAEGMLRIALGALERVWIAPLHGADWSAAVEGMANLCAAAVREVAAETRRIAKDARAAGAGGAKRMRNEASPPSAAPEDVKETGGSAVDQLRQLIARTKRFLDTPSHA